MTGLDDTYNLSDGKTPPSEDEDVCRDGCVYTRTNPDAGDEDDEYCFKNMQSEGSVQCQVGYFRYWVVGGSTTFICNAKGLFLDKL